MANAQDEDEWLDITNIVNECAATLSYQDPLICNVASFNLHDSMAALELMDRKMDCCEIPANLVGPGSPETMLPPRPMPSGLGDLISDLPWENVTLRQTAVIALESLTRLEALLSGASMPESTYTSMYAHNAVLSDMRKRLDTTSSITEQLGQLMKPSEKKKERNEPTTSQLALYATTLAMVEISDVVRSIVLHADIYEEEDFSVSMFGLQVFEESEENEASGVIHSCLSMLERNVSMEANILRHVLRFQVNFLQACTAMGKLTAEIVRPTCEQVQLFVRAGIEELKALKAIQGSLEVGDNETKLLKGCFDPYFYRPLVGSSPTRKIVYKKPAESIDILTKVIGEIADTTCHILLEASTLPQLRRLLHKVSTSSVNILSRSLIVLNMYFDDRLLGQYNLTNLIGQDMQQVSAVLSLLLETKNGVAFLNRLAKPVYDTLKMLVLNRNRQRTYLEAIMFPDWTTLQGEAHSVDAVHRQELNLGENLPPFFLQYVLCTTAALMDHYVALGIELELFQGQHDLGVAYWYREFLLSTMLTTTAQMRQVKALSKNQQEVSKNNDTGQALKRTKEDREADFAYMTIMFKRSMCRGLVRFIAALNQAEVVENDSYEFTSHEERFRKRFDPFACIAQPPPLAYDDFRQGSDFSNVTANDLLASTADCFGQCKSLLDGLSAMLADICPQNIVEREEDLRKLRKIAVGNAVFLVRLKQMVEKGSKSGAEKVLFDFGVTNEFCTIKLE
jgi:Mak10 subunit, NatC N(alpha)-terminal acetyltransferase